MTEQLWLACNDPKPMLKMVRDRSDRKLRLFALACVWEDIRFIRLMFPPHPIPDDFIEAAICFERYADGLVTREEWSQTRRKANWTPWSYDNAYREADIAILCAAGAANWDGQKYRGDNHEQDELNLLAQFLRCIFGNPFRVASVTPSWLTSTVTALARSIYDDRSFDKFPILADALEDAGCADETILTHCRQPDAHVRGCWVVDLLLGKE